jgi:hypothetical protein
MQNIPILIELLRRDSSNYDNLLTRLIDMIRRNSIKTKRLSQQFSSYDISNFSDKIKFNELKRKTS